MKIQQIRNATLRIEYAGKTFLTDPWLLGKGAMGTFRSIGNVFRCAKEVLAGVDAYICTHVHPDHIDMSPDGAIGGSLNKDTPIFVQSMEDAHAFVRSGFTEVTVLYENSEFEGVHLVKVPGRHGTKIPCGPSCGVIFHHPEEKTLYLAGDTIWYDAVEKTIRAWNPGVIVVNACAAVLLDEGRLIMDDGDVENVVRAGDGAKIIVSHMDTVAHATITRTDMKQRLTNRGVWDKVIMPDDGETLTF